MNNEFFAKACQEWKERLIRGDFTPETMAKSRADIEKDKSKIDAWKVRNFEPVWGIRKDFLEKVDEEDQKVAISSPKKPKKESTIKEEASLGDLTKIKSKRKNSPERNRKGILSVINDEDEDQPLLKKVKAETVLEAFKDKVAKGEEDVKKAENDVVDGKVEELQPELILGDTLATKGIVFIFLL